MHVPDNMLSPSARMSPAKRALLEMRLRGQVLVRTKTQAIPKRPEGAGTPLSFAQQRLWFLHQVAPESAVHNVPAALRLEGALNSSALREAFNGLIRRHEILRTTFTEVDGQPVATVNPPPKESLPVFDLRTLPSAEQGVRVRQLADEEARRPFDLERGSVIRTRLIKLSDTAHVLLVTLHHIAVDGWSMHVLVREMAELYAAAMDKRPVRLPELPIQYADFAHWQRKRLQGETLQRHLTYWERQLSDMPVLNFPTDHPRSLVPAYDGATVRFNLSRATTTRLETLSTDAGVTLFTTLLAVFSVILHRYTGQTDIATGTVIANRNRTEIEGLIGFFVNALPLRVNLSGNPDFMELLRRAGGVVQEAYDHQDLPFDKLVQDLKLPRDTARNPLFQVSLALGNTPKASIELAGLKIALMDVDIGATQFDLTVHFSKQDGELVGSIAYNTTLYDKARSQRLSWHFVNILEGVAVRPDKRISELSVLTEPERRQLLIDFNATATDYPRDKCIHELFEAQVDRTPEAVAVVHEGQHLAYGQLNAKANQLAHYLRAQGVGPDTLVGFCVERSLEMIVGVLGVLKAGGGYLPIDPSYPRERKAFLLEDAAPTVLLTQEFLLDELCQAGNKCVCLDKDWSLIAEYPPTNFQAASTPSNLAYVIYTSGSTGKPKGVVIAHHNVVHSTMARLEYYREPVGCFLLLSSFAFDSSVAGIFWTLSQGGALCLPAKAALKDPGVLVDLINREGVTHLLCVPSLYRLILSLHSGHLGSLQSVIVAGEACPPELVEQHCLAQPEVALFNEYGPTEGTVWASVRRLGVQDAQNVVPIGRPIANTCIYLLDTLFNPVPMGVAGELCLGGAGLARGYLNRPELTAERFIPNPFGDRPGERLYRTGDLARYRVDGTIEYLGRFDNQIKLRGYRIELEEIEAKLAQHPSVKEVAVTVYENDSKVRGLAAYVLPNTASEYCGQLSSDVVLREQLSEWQSAINEWYAQPAAPDDPSMNCIGWQSSFTGEAFPMEEMKEWVDQTIDLVRRYKPKRILEIGCGSGLLLFRLAPICERYVGTDFSLNALEHVRKGLAMPRHRLPQVELLHRRADDFSGLRDRSFDLVLLNSVVQYFPNAHYLEAVLHSAIALLAPGGRLVVGDVRHLGLLDAFHAAVEMHHAQDSTQATDLWRRVQSRARRENEFLLDPRFFHAFARTSPRATSVEVLLKRGRYQNEMVRFRYDVVVSLDARQQQVDNPKSVAWKELLCLNEITQLLVREAPDFLIVHDVPNSRVTQATRAVEILRSDICPATIGDLRRLLDESVPVGIDPEHARELAADVPYRVSLSWARSTEDGRFALLFSKDGLPSLVNWVPSLDVDHVMSNAIATFSNDPLRNRRVQQLTRVLRGHLQACLPDYMLPSAYVLVDEMPVGPNGKVDRAALPKPNIAEESDEHYEPARTATEEILVSLWAEVLGVNQIGVHDDFFRLGGHSLLVVHLVKRIRETINSDVPLIGVFQAPTVAKYSAWLAEWAGNSKRLLVSLRNGAETIPLYCIHSGAGDLRGYDHLIETLKPGRAVYGIQWGLLMSPGAPVSSIESLAAQYAKILRQNSDGPYLLLGWSLGGLIAYKVARRLEEEGVNVAFLGIIDSFLSDSRGTEDLGPSTFERYLRDSEDVTAFRKLRPQDYAELDDITTGLPYEERMFRVGIWGHERGYWLRDASIEYMRVFKELMRHSAAMIESFHQTTISSDIYLWWAKESWARNKGRPLEWSRFTAGTVYEDIIEGDHFGMMRNQNLHLAVSEAIEAMVGRHETKWMTG